ncbi:MAG: signal peptidase I [Chloroflexi bacterium]|nr:signal peptidase I [Chloroflexota bacterium]
MPRMLTSLSFVVRGDSMRPALRDGHRILVDTRAYQHAPPARGDVVLFWRRLLGQRERIPSIKRVMGLPGEHLQMREGKVYLNGAPLWEPYAPSTPPPEAGLPSQWVVGAGQYFLLGDNRGDSYDSRRLGPVDAGDLLGVAWLRYWPPWAWGRIS